MDNLRVLIIADDPLARAGLATLLVEQAGCNVVGQVSGGVNLADDLPVFEPDVIVWDLGWAPAMPTSLEHLADLGQDRPPVLALLPDQAHAAGAVSAGVEGALRRETDGERLAAAITAVARGLVVLDGDLAGSLLPAADQSLDDSPAEDLTPRESEVLQLLAEGLSNRAIARQLDISDHTVKFHVAAIMGKLGAQSRTEAVVRATRLGLIIL